MTESPKVSFIIPTLNEEHHLRTTLQHLNAMEGAFEVLIVDGGSMDRTRRIARQFPGVHFLESTADRARQLNVGGEVAKAPYLFFLHADSRPPLQSISIIEGILQDPANIGGSFYLKFDRQHPGYHMISVLTRLNISFLTYGDQGLFLRKQTFRELLGFPNQPIMEDYEMQRQLRRLGHFVKVQEPMHTSARRFENNGFLRQVLVDLLILIGYKLGIPPQKLKDWYPDTARASR